MSTDLFRKDLSVFIYLFNRHGAHDSTLMTFKGHQGYMLDLLLTLAKELLARREQHLSILTLNFDLKFYDAGIRKE